MSGRAALVAGNWLLFAVAPMLLVVHAAILIGVIVALAELLTPLVNSIISGARVAATPDHLQGRVQAASTAVAMSLGWLGPLAIGVAFQHAGASPTVLLISGWALGLALAATLAPALRDAPPPPGPTVPEPLPG